jgi:tRNA 2-thiouridine synthesizing protein A
MLARPRPPREDTAVTAPPRDPVIIDGGDRCCTALLLELRACIQQLPTGTVIHLIAADPAAPIDLPAWCHLTGHTYLGPLPAARPSYALRTVSAPTVTEPASPWRRRT